MYNYVYYSDQIEDVNNNYYGVCTTAHALAHSHARRVKRCPPITVLAVNILTNSTELLHLIQVSSPALGLSYESTHATLNEHTYASCSLRMNYNQQHS